MAKGIIEQQAYDKNPNPSFFEDAEKNIDAQIAKEQAAENQPIQVDPVVVNNGERQSMTQVTPVTGIPTQQQGPVSVRPKTASERLQEFYATVRPAKPVYDPNRIEEINRLKKNNSLGEGLKVLGDVFALAKGANVNRRPENTKNDRLTQAAWDYMDKYNALLNDWNYKDYIAKMRGADDKKRQAEQDKKGDDYRANALKMRADELAWQKKKPYIDFDLWKKKWDLQNAADLEKAIKAGSKGDKGEYLYDDNGKQIYQIRTDAERDKLLSLVLSDPEANRELDALKAEFGENLSSKEIKNYLVAKYWSRSPQVLEYVSASQGTGQEGTNNTGIVWVNNLMNRPPYQAPGSSSTSQPSTPAQQPEKEPQYSTGGYY